MHLLALNQNVIFGSYSVNSFKNRVSYPPGFESEKKRPAHGMLPLHRSAIYINERYLKTVFEIA